jgi:hypothetical protein
MDKNWRTVNYVCAKDATFTLVLKINGNITMKIAFSTPILSDLLF